MLKEIFNNRLIFIILVLFISGCQSQPKVNPQSNNTFTGYSPHPSKALQHNWYHLIGSWQGEYQLNEKESYQWNITHTLDGNFKVTSKWYAGEELMKQEHFAGVWGVDKDYYFNITNRIIEDGQTRQLNLDGPYNHELYRIIKLNNNIFIYEHTDSGIRFTSERISATQSQYE